MVHSHRDNHEDFIISKDDDTEWEEELDREDYYGNKTGILQNK